MVFLCVVFKLTMSPQSQDLMKLSVKQALGIALALPTAGMSLAMNLTSIDEYQQKYHPDFNWFMN